MDFAVCIALRLTVSNLNINMITKRTVNIISYEGLPISQYDAQHIVLFLSKSSIVQFNW